MNGIRGTFTNVRIIPLSRLEDQAVAAIQNALNDDYFYEYTIFKRFNKKKTIDLIF